jgi:hypothetical protein
MVREPGAFKVDLAIKPNKERTDIETEAIPRA